MGNLIFQRRKYKPEIFKTFFCSLDTKSHFEPKMFCKMLFHDPLPEGADIVMRISQVIELGYGQSEKKGRRQCLQ